MTEKELMESVRQIARLAGWQTYHTHNSRRSEPGFPDLVLVRAPRLIFVELKSDAGRVTEHQERWLETLRGTSAEVYVWRPADLQLAARVLSTRYVEGAP